MPTYDYKCNACSHTFEHMQSMKDKPLRKCPECGKASLERLIGTGAAVIFKGGGFYQTDYRSESYRKAAEADSKAANPDSKTDTKQEAKPEAKPDGKPEGKTEGKSSSESSARPSANDPKREPGSSGKPSRSAQDQPRASSAESRPKERKAAIVPEKKSRRDAGGSKSTPRRKN